MNEVTRILSAMEQGDPHAAEQLLPLVYGLTLDEAAQALGISSSTADRYWTFARAWLYRELLDSA